MKHEISIGILSILGLCGALAFTGMAQAVDVKNLEGFEAIFDRYAPAGDCKRQPQIILDKTGFTFETAGKSEKATHPEYAASYGGNFYEGISLWFFLILILTRTGRCCSRLMPTRKKGYWLSELNLTTPAVRNSMLDTRRWLMFHPIKYVNSFAGSQPPGWEPYAASSSLPCFGKLEPIDKAQDRLPRPHSQAEAWERANEQNSNGLKSNS